MEREFLPYPESLELKELGFDEPCFGYYNTSGFNFNLKIKNSNNLIEAEHLKGNWCTAPTFSQAFGFLREKYKIHYGIDYECSQHDHKWGYNWSIYNYNQVVKTDEEYITSHPNAPAGEWIYETYEQAELECLRKVIEIVKQKENMV